MTNRSHGIRAFAGLLLFAGLAGCGDGGDKVDPVTISDGFYAVIGGRGYLASDEAKVLAVTARLDRTAGSLVLTMADGSQQALTISFRPQGEWRADCYTMNSHSLNELAELSPAPLQVESMSFARPVVFPKCNAQRLILSSAPGDEAYYLALDRR
jgi:hypothetical protein